MYKREFGEEHSVGYNRFYDIIERHNLKVRKKKRRAKTTDSDHDLPLYPEAVADVRVIWLDGSEEDQGVTAIQSVKKANADKGAIYNLAGQKINASYKGVVIKDGKKFIQK